MSSRQAGEVLVSVIVSPRSVTKTNGLGSLVPLRVKSQPILRSSREAPDAASLSDSWYQVQGTDAAQEQQPHKEADDRSKDNTEQAIKKEHQ